MAEQGWVTEWRVQWIANRGVDLVEFGEEFEEGRRDFTDEDEAREYYDSERARGAGPHWRIELRQRGLSPWAAVLSSGYVTPDEGTVR